MKIIIGALCAIFSTSTLASAAPRPLLQTTATGPNKNGGKEILTAPSLVAKSGQQSLMTIGDLLKYTITATVQRNGAVLLDVRMLSASTAGANIAAPRIKTRLGYEAPVCAGQWQFTTKTSLAK